MPCPKECHLTEDKRKNFDQMEEEWLASKTWWSQTELYTTRFLKCLKIVACIAVIALFLFGSKEDLTKFLLGLSK